MIDGSGHFGRAVSSGAKLMEYSVPHRDLSCDRLKKVATK